MSSPPGSVAAVDLPGRVTPWCRDHLGAEPVALLHQASEMSEVIGPRLAGA